MCSAGMSPAVCAQSRNAGGERSAWWAGEPVIDLGLSGLLKGEVVLVQPNLGCAVDIVRVIEQKAGFVAVAKILDARDLHTVARLSEIEVIDELGCLVEENQFHVKGITDTLDMGEEFVAILFCARYVSGPVDQPCDLGARNLLLDLLNPNPRGPDEIHPPIVMRRRFPLLPDPKGYTPGDDDEFSAGSRGRGIGGSQRRGA